MRIFITGGTGFLGSYAVDAFLKDDHDVAVLVRPETDPWRIASRLKDVKVISGALDNPGFFSNDLTLFRPDTVLNIAWTGVNGRTHDDPAQRENLSRALTLLEVSAKAGAKNFIGLGSHAEYGLCKNTVSEDQPTLPVSEYGKSKLKALGLTKDLCAQYDMRFAWVRLFACYGPRDREFWLMSYVIKTLFRHEEPELTEGKQLWDYLYVADAADALLAVANSPDARGVFNLGSGSAVTVRSVVETIRDQINPALPLGFGKRSIPADLVMCLEADISKLTAATGWKPPLDSP